MKRECDPYPDSIWSATKAKTLDDFLFDLGTRRHLAPAEPIPPGVMGRTIEGNDLHGNLTRGPERDAQLERFRNSQRRSSALRNERNRQVRQSTSTQSAQRTSID